MFHFLSRSVSSKDFARGVHVFKRLPGWSRTMWSEIESKMQNQEHQCSERKTETRDQFRIGLARTARNLLPAFIRKSIRDMTARCKKLFNAKGGLFEEGGIKKNKRSYRHKGPKVLSDIPTKAYASPLALNIKYNVW